MIVLVGENNPYGGDPHYALYPEPSNSAGGRLCRLVLGMAEAEYLSDERFKRVNLLQRPKWSAPAAREAAAEMLLRFPEPQKFILLGRKVFDAFTSHQLPGLPKATQEWSPCSVYAERFLALPHPSGLNRFWGQPGSFTQARNALRLFGAIA